MASGDRHDYAIRVMGPWINLAAIALVVGNPEYRHFWPQLPTAIAAYWFGGFLVTPDLDLAITTHARWGVLGYFWFFYYKTFRHRGKYLRDWGPSHWPFIGTATRLVYAAIVIAIIVAIAERVLLGWHPFTGLLLSEEFQAQYGSAIAKTVYAIFAGIEVAAWVHYLMDIKASYFPKTEPDSKS